MRNYKGIIDMVVSGQESAISFAAQIKGNKASHKFPPINRRGRGSSGSPKIRLGDFSASGSGSGLVQWQSPPFPTNPKYATGTLTRILKLDASGAVTHSIAFPIRITDIEFEYVEKNNTAWEITFGWQADGAVTIVWGGNQVVVSPPSANDQETYDGLMKVLDGNDLTSTATQRIDCEGIADTDAAEVTKLVAMIASSSPMTGLKIVSAQWVRSDSNGGQVVLTWGKRDSKDEQELPRTTQIDDSTNIGSEGSIAQLDGTPAVPSGYTLVSTVTEHPTADHTITTLKYALRTTAGGIEYDESPSNTDPSDLETVVLDTHVYTTLSGAPSSSPPSGLVLVNTKNVVVNNLKSKVTYTYAKDTSAQKWLNQRTSTYTDPKGLRSTQTKAAIDTAPDAVDAGFVDRGIRYENITHDHVGQIREGGLLTTEDEAVLPEQSVVQDAGNLQDMVTISQVWVIGSPPSDPATPNGVDGNPLKLVNRRDKYLTPSSTTSKMLRIWTFGRNDSKDDIERSIRHGSFSDYDPNTLDGSARVTIVATSQPATPSAPIAGVKYVRLTSRPCTDQYSIWMFEYEPLDSIDRLQLQRVSLDQSAVPTQSEAEVPVVDGTPTAPATLSTGILAEKETRQLANGHILTLGKFNLRGTHQTQMQNDGSEVSGGPTISDSYEKQIVFVSCLATDTQASLWTTYSAVYAGTTSTQGYKFRCLRVRKYTPTCAILTLIFQNPALTAFVDNTVKADMDGDLSLVSGPSWINFNSSGNATLSITDIITRGSGKYLIRFAPYTLKGIGGPFSVTQKFSGTTPPLHLDKLGLCNSISGSSFLGLPQGSSIYTNVKYRIVESNTTSTYLVTWFFDLFWAKFFVGHPTISGMPSNGLVYATSVSGLSVGDWVGTYSAPNWTWNITGGPTITATFPVQDNFGWTTWTQ